METIAVYFEKRIKTYGFSLFPAQEMLTLQLEKPRIRAWTKILDEMEGAAATFSFVFTRPGSDAELALACISGKETTDRLVDNAAKTGVPVSSRTVVDLLFFHGPHFNERPGIASETITALARNDIQPLAVSCSASSVHLVLPEGIGAAAKVCLESAFEVPKDQVGKIRRARKTRMKADGK